MEAFGRVLLTATTLHNSASLWRACGGAAASAWQRAASSSSGTPTSSSSNGINAFASTQRLRLFSSSSLSAQAQYQHRPRMPTPRRPDTQEQAVMRTRVVFAAIRTAKEAMTSHELFDRLQKEFPESGVQSRHHLKLLLRRLKDAGWVKPVPGGRNSPYKFIVTPKGEHQPLDSMLESRHLRLAREKLEQMKAAGQLQQDSTTE